MAKMSDTRHQVFVSSTFTDLQTERKKVQQVLLEMNCLPAGMELFPATDDEQWQFIKRVIDDCDYYVVIVAGRYGSTTAEGVSYTEKEFDYAVERGIPVLGFLHSDPNSIPSGQSELEPTARERLLAFRAKVASNRLVKEWKNADELAARVVLSVSNAIKTHPAPGWVRGPASDSADLLRQINELRGKNDELQARLGEVARTKRLKLPDLALTTETFKLSGRCLAPWHHDWSADVSWDVMLSIVGPELLMWQPELKVKRDLALPFARRVEAGTTAADIDEEIFQTVRIQMLALGYIEVQTGTSPAGAFLYWHLTPSGQQRLMEVRTVKSAVATTAATD